MSEPRILLGDVETLPATVHVWRAKAPRFISADNLIEEAHMCCASWKWLGGERIYSARMDLNDEIPDRPILAAMSEALGKADAFIAHNGDEFDLKWIRGRMVKAGMMPPRPVVQIDTLKMSRQQFGDNAIFSHKLDFLAKFLGIPVRKIKVDFDLWKKVKRNVPGALATMIEYNRHDLRVLEPVYLRLRSYAPAKLNRNHWSDGDVCPSCGSDALQSRGTGVSAVSTYRRLQCQGCGAWSKKPMNSKVVR